LAKSIVGSVILFLEVLAGKLKSPSALSARAGLFSNPGILLRLPWNAEVRRHARHVMMVVMTMVGANLHLIPP
jgi:hypothetical protein